LIINAGQYAPQGKYICTNCGSKFDVYNDGYKMQKCEKCGNKQFLRNSFEHDPPTKP